jgi:hypothetical protein
MRGNKPSSLIYNGSPVAVAAQKQSNVSLLTLDNLLALIGPRLNRLRVQATEIVLWSCVQLRHRATYSLKRSK